MAVTWADVACFDPALLTVPPGTQACILAAVKLTIHACPWGDKYDLAVTLLAAHIGLMYLRSAAGVSGVVVEEKVGDVMRKYGMTSSGTASDLDGTPWGQWYQRLLRGLLGARGPLVT